MIPMFFVFSAGRGAAEPKLVSTATLKGATVQCDHVEYRQWLQDAVDRVVEDVGIPRDEEAAHVVIDRACSLRSGSYLFVSPTPFL